MEIRVPDLSLVVMIGASGSGKSSFARKHFQATEILSSDAFRAMISDDETNQTVSGQAFELLHNICAKRLALGRLTVIDATNVQHENRKTLLELAKRAHVPAVAIVLKTPPETCHERNQTRGNRNFGSHVVKGHYHLLEKSIKHLDNEGFRFVYVLETPDDVANANIVRVKGSFNRKDEGGPFDLIGDVHGCLDELVQLLGVLGYTTTEVEDVDGRSTFDVSHPEGRKIVFVGDLVDRGPNTPGVLRLVMRAFEKGVALSVRGNHDDKLLRKLKGRDVNITHGLQESLDQLAKEPPEFLERATAFLEKLPYHLIFDGGKLVVAHAGLRAELHGRTSERVRAFCLYGATTGEMDTFGLPVRLNWAIDYQGAARVVYGHTPTLEATWLNNTICIDTGCVFGGKLTALRYPNSELVSVPALKTYAEAKRPLINPSQEQTSVIENSTETGLPSIQDVLGKQVIDTSWMKNIRIQEGESAAALEAISRFGIDPRWLIYLPPTMSPCLASDQEGFLEHPKQAFDYFTKNRVPEVICEQKHMGSRAVVIIGRDAASIEIRFGIPNSSGVVYTRTGRKFFSDEKLEAEFLEVIRKAMTASNFWEAHQTSWACLDGELMPWSEKAQELLKRQYAASGTSGQQALSEVLATIPTGTQSPELQAIRQKFSEKKESLEKFIDTYRGYCWPVESVNDLKFAPFHLLATEKATHLGKDHLWHLESLGKVADASSGVVIRTPYHLVNLADPLQIQKVIDWWLDLTQKGGEGMVVKPKSFIHQSERGLVQPALKVRGKEYLRLIYGPDYDTAENLSRLRNRRQWGRKQSLALREFCLGAEALQRFTSEGSFRSVHQCVFAVLALESDPVDPRL